MEEPPAEDNADEINTTVLELQDAFAAALRNCGVLGRLRAQLRAAAVSVIRGDPHLRAAAVGRATSPSSLTAAGRVALLLIEDFAAAHGLRRTLGVFEEEGNVALVGRAEREAARRLAQWKGEEASVLETIIAAAMNNNNNNNNNNGVTSLSLLSPLQKEQPGTAPNSSAASSSSSASSSLSVRGGVRAGEGVDGEPQIEAPHHPEIEAGLKEYEDSVDYSVVSAEDAASFNEAMFDNMEKF